MTMYMWSWGARNTSSHFEGSQAKSQQMYPRNEGGASRRKQLVTQSTPMPPICIHALPDTSTRSPVGRHKTQTETQRSRDRERVRVCVRVCACVRARVCACVCGGEAASMRTRKVNEHRAFMQATCCHTWARSRISRSRSISFSGHSVRSCPLARHASLWLR